MIRIRYKEYPCGNHRSNHVFINDGDIGSDYYRARLIPPRGIDKWVVQITNSKEQIINEVYAFTLSGAKIMARGLLVGMGAQLADEVRRTK